MILVIRIDDTDEPYMMDPKIPKIIVVDDMVMPRKYLRETDQSIVTCSLPILLILSGKPNQGVFQPSIRIAFYPEVVQVVALPAEKALENFVELPEGISQRDDDATAAQTLQLELHLKFSRLAAVRVASVAPTDILAQSLLYAEIDPLLTVLHGDQVLIEPEHHLPLQELLCSELIGIKLKEGAQLVEPRYEGPVGRLGEGDTRTAIVEVSFNEFRGNTLNLQTSTYTVEDQSSQTLDILALDAVQHETISGRVVGNDNTATAVDHQEVCTPAQRRILLCFDRLSLKPDIIQQFLCSSYLHFPNLLIAPNIPWGVRKVIGKTLDCWFTNKKIPN